jgi:hypothetical protein
VQPIDQFPIYELGAALQQLKEAVSSSQTIEPRDQMGALWFAEYQLSRLMSGTPFHVSFCKEAAQALLGNIHALLNELNKTPKTPGVHTLTSPQPEAWRWYAIRSGIDVFEHQFGAELKRMATYGVPDRGIFKTEALVDSADRHIHDSVRSAVPQFAIAEFQAAGRCLAFGLYSASGFHSARAVENVLRKYQQKFLQVQESDEMTLGQMASALDDMHNAKKKSPKLPAKNTIRHIKDFNSFDRNPLIHKTVILQEIDAVTLFNAAASLIVEMSKELLIEQQKNAVVVPSNTPFQAVEAQEVSTR